MRVLSTIVVGGGPGGLGPLIWAAQQGLLADWLDQGVALVERNLEQEAVPAFTRAVELDPNDAGKRNNLGNALASTGRLDEAVIQFRRGLALAPRDVRLHNALGLVLAARGDADEALAEFRQAMAIDPANEETRRDFATAFPRLSSAGRTP